MSYPRTTLRTLYVTSDLGNSLQAISPVTGKEAARRSLVADPYNMYFTPDGQYAITGNRRAKRSSASTSATRTR